MAETDSKTLARRECVLAWQRVFNKEKKSNILTEGRLIMEKLLARYCGSSEGARQIAPYRRLNENIQIALKLMTENQLVAFSWACRFPLEAKTLNPILNMHQQSLKILQVDGDILDSIDELSWYHPGQLSTLIWQPRIGARELKHNFLFANRQTFRALRVGPERATFSRYARLGPEGEAAIRTYAHNFFEFWCLPEPLMMVRSCALNYSAST